MVGLPCLSHACRGRAVVVQMLLHDPTLIPPAGQALPPMASLVLSRCAEAVHSTLYPVANLPSSRSLERVLTPSPTPGAAAPGPGGGLSRPPWTAGSRVGVDAHGVHKCLRAGVARWLLQCVDVNIDRFVVAPLLAPSALMAPPVPTAPPAVAPSAKPSALMAPPVPTAPPAVAPSAKPSYTSYVIVDPWWVLEGVSDINQSAIDVLQGRRRQAAM